MAVTSKVLLEAKAAEAAQTTQYTAPAATTTLIDKFIVANNTNAAVQFAINIVQSAGAVATANRIINRSIPANSTDLCPEMINQYLAAGDFVSTLAGSAAALTIRMSGREVA